MTEVTCSLLGWDSTDKSIPSSVGELNANCSAKIMAPDGETEVPRGERGEIWVQGPKFVLLSVSIAMCYLLFRHPNSRKS
jgi:4-coumarate--CoA ligase